MMDVRPTLVVNAGGQSRRMGRPKALLAVPPTGKPLLAHVVERLRPVAAERIVVVANEPGLTEAIRLDGEATWVSDAYPDAGTLGGIATALREVSGWALIVACDLPFVSASVCGWLAGLAASVEGSAGEVDVVVPIVSGYEEPLHALYHSRCLPHIERRLAQGERRVISFFPDVRVCRVEEHELRQLDPMLRSFVNVNTAQEWDAALAILAESGPSH
jgi:molybdopterin-guanine dinucleotide biosynthesis protein A